MADRTAAGIFGIFFGQLATDYERAGEDYDEPGDHRAYLLKLARSMWTETWNYDFSPYQMERDEALLTLDLANDSDRTRMYRSRDGQVWESDH